jgi:hypothetical protein
VGIKQEGNKQDYKVKDLDVFDGKKQKLRSWLTAANLQLVNKGIEGDERKVRFIGGYLRDIAIGRVMKSHDRNGMTGLPGF